MKKFLMIAGAVALGVVALIVALATVVAIRGRRLDREGKRYADGAIVAIASHWNERALLDRASPGYLTACPPACTDEIFGQASRLLGPLEHYLGSKGGVNVFFWTGSGTTVTGSYVGHGAFARGPAEIRLDIIKRGGKWRITGFHVHIDRMPSPAAGSA